MQEANDEAQRILANEELRMAAQVRLNVTRNKLYTSLIREYFQQAQSGSQPIAGIDKKDSNR
jgi:hypothetical protein